MTTLPEARTEIATTVNITTLDALFGGVGLFPEILLKLDVQGAEAEVLQGAQEFLKSVKYFVSEISLAPAYQGQCDFNLLHTLLTQAGFKLKGFIEQVHIADFTPMYADVLYVNTSQVET